jgi:hypothetical protein
MNPIQPNNNNEPSRNESSLVGRLWGRIIEAAHLTSQVIHEWGALHYNVPIVGSKHLLERTVDLPGYLALLDFEGVKAIATQLVDECARPEGFSEEAHQVYRALIGRLDAEGLSVAERAELTNILREGGLEEGFRSNKHEEQEVLSHGNIEVERKPEDSVLALPRIEELPVIEGVPVEVIIKEACSSFVKGDDAAKQEAANVLLGLVEKDKALAGGIVKEAFDVLRGGGDSAKVHAVELLLALSRMEGAPVEAIIKEARGVFEEGDDAARKQTVRLLLGIAPIADSIAITGIINDGSSMIVRDRSNAQRDDAAELLLGLAHRKNLSIKERISAAERVFMRVPEAMKQVAVEPLLRLAELGHDAFKQITGIAESGFFYSRTEQGRAASEALLLGLLKIENASIEDKVSAAFYLLQDGTPEAKGRTEAFLRELLEEGASIEDKIKVANLLLKNGTPEIKGWTEAFLRGLLETASGSIEDKIKVAEQLLLSRAHPDNRDVETFLLGVVKDTSLLAVERMRIATLVLSKGSQKGQTAAFDLIVEWAFEENAPLSEILEQAIKAFIDRRFDPKSRVPELLMKLTHIKGAPLEKVIAAAREELEYLSHINHQRVEREVTSINILIGIIQINDVPIAEKIAAANAIIQYGSLQAKEKVAASLLPLAATEGVGIDLKIQLFETVLQYGIPEAKEKAAALLLQLVETDILTVDEKNTILTKVLQHGTQGAKREASKLFLSLVDVIIEKLGSMGLPEKRLAIDKLSALVLILPMGEAKDKILFYFAHHVLRDADFAGDRNRLLAVSRTITDALVGFEDDERYQIALGVQLQLQDPNAQNAFTVYKAAHSKREALRGVDLDSSPLPVVNGENEARYTLVGSSIQRALPIPELAAMPHAAYDEFVQLGNHLREAVQHCSKEQKAMLLEIDADGFSEDAINARMVDRINGLLANVLQSNEIAAWMTPHREGGFLRTKYELQAVVRHAHDLLTDWKDSGSVHGAELSPAAGTFFQLLVNITSCPSGKAAGVHTAFVEVPGLHSPMSEDALIEPLSEELKTFLASREEADIQVRPKVLAFIEDANELYRTFRMELLNGDGPFIQGITGKSGQPSHQHDYAYLVLSEALGLSLKGEVIPVDLHGQIVSAALKNRDGETLLKAYFETVFEGGRNFTEALVDKFHAHWSAKIEAGLNNANASKAEKEAYNDFLKVLSAAGINANTCLDYEDEDNEIYSLKKSAVPDILCALGVLKTV